MLPETQSCIRETTSHLSNSIGKSEWFYIIYAKVSFFYVDTANIYFSYWI